MPERELDGDGDGDCAECKRVEQVISKDQFPGVQVSMVFEDDLEDGEDPPRRFVVVQTRTRVNRGTAIGVCIRADFLDGTADWLHNVRPEGA